MPLASARIVPSLALVLVVTTAGDAAVLAVVETASVVVVDAAFFFVLDLPHAPRVNPRMTTAATAPPSRALRMLNLLVPPRASYRRPAPFQQRPSSRRRWLRGPRTRRR